ncbi:uncharacterized protein RSE6_14130 [Rhynchosporium secalis]|uniref:Uncharacterized protein n=1 Tax=Rhynchosporium secalis TaxID=38038 RepID=A0A1E1MUI0_RHYSE|nr:uncharacterized protein RSE6_14130 [Rhynchosporium secalis]
MSALSVPIKYLLLPASTNLGTLLELVFGYLSPDTKSVHAMLSDSMSHPSWNQSI